MNLYSANSDLTWLRCRGGRVKPSTSDRNDALDTGSEVSSEECR